MLSEISTTREIRPGFIQAVYKKRGERAIVLLFRVARGAELPEHSHPERQFGYTFQGEYDFVIDHTSHLALGGHSYLIEAHVLHSAVALTDYYSLDFKYRGAKPLPAPVVFDVIRPSRDANGQRIGEVYFDSTRGNLRAVVLRAGVDYRLPALPPEASRERVLAMSAAASVTIQNRPTMAEAMKIYRVEESDALDIRIDTPGTEAFLFEI
jgi:hypothetical protein